tara:strand:+ start:850 stop:1605 length:756 start_codon:yes stop_codon:yes gene_type:complete
MKVSIAWFCFAILFSSFAAAQYSKIDSTQGYENHHFKLKSLIIPTALLTYGVIGIESDAIKNVDGKIKEEVNEHIDEKFTIDDFSQYAPALGVYGLNALGIEGKHNFKERTIILASSYILMSSSVLGLKSIVRAERPDGSSRNSWPSGHTATAFMGAEFLWQEYKDVSIWYGVTGYVIAAGTGAFRIYNDRHWFSDVASGAAIGILSTKIGYWIYPFLNDKIFHGKHRELSGMLQPFHNGRETGLALAITF